ncbi:MAG: hypothetical protein BGO26_02760 [Actinobacteria bacterium 69-20]|jgi:hypothetical protein|nr:hypothetical protein [Actinomycetota bacterium]OJV30919.1 MAG: hypothetical protein BGO26_02760 [Actinobacteria bacterium 69-20]
MNISDLHGELAEQSADAPDLAAVRSDVDAMLARRTRRHQARVIMAVAAAVVVLIGGVTAGTRLLVPHPTHPSGPASGPASVSTHAGTPTAGTGSLSTPTGTASTESPGASPTQATTDTAPAVPTRPTELGKASGVLAVAGPFELSVPFALTPPATGRADLGWSASPHSGLVSVGLPGYVPIPQDAAKPDEWVGGSIDYGPEVPPPPTGARTITVGGHVATTWTDPESGSPSQTTSISWALPDGTKIRASSNRKDVAAVIAGMVVDKPSTVTVPAGATILPPGLTFAHAEFGMTVSRTQPDRLTADRSQIVVFCSSGTEPGTEFDSPDCLSTSRLPNADAAEAATHPGFSDWAVAIVHGRTVYVSPDGRAVGGTNASGDWDEVIAGSALPVTPADAAEMLVELSP